MRRALLIAALALAAALVAPGSAAAAFGLADLDVFYENAAGEAELRAGAHPHAMRVSFELETEETEGGGILLPELPKTIELAQVPGLVGNPTAVPRCPTADFLTLREAGTNRPACPDATALGYVMVETLINEAPGIALFSAVYNLEPAPGQPARLGFWTSGVPVTIDAGVNPAPPNNIVATTANISQIVEVLGTDFTLWGTPADPAHDDLRGSCLAEAAEGEPGDWRPISLGECPVSVPLTPFLTMPRACEGPLATAYRAESWQSPGAWVGGSVLTHDEFGNPRGMAGCGELDFAPATATTPSSAAAESATGLRFEIEVSDQGLANPAGRAAADIRALTLALPAGMTLNPSAAEGLGVCTRAQYEAESLVTRACPAAAKLGTIEADTPILENHTLHGSLYAALPDDPATAAPGAENPFDSLLALYIVIRDPGLGVFVKLAARVDTDPLSGQIITTVEDLPPFPLSRVSTRLRSGPRAPLITPPACGAYAALATLTPSSGKPALTDSSSFAIASGPGGSPCPPAGSPPFDPGFEAGTLNNAAGAFSPVSMRLTRRDGEQDLTRFSATLAPGLIGKVAGLARCPEAALAAAAAKSGRAELAAPSCPAGARIGSVLAGAGVGTALTYVGGSLYLAGPYNGAPLSVAAIVPAVAGPFDVGTIITRVALRLDPNNGRVIVDGAASDPIPHILEGIPLKVRDIRILTDPGFTLNPTSCEPTASEATIFGSGANPFSGADDTAVARSSRFQASSCASLGFKPRLKLRLTGATKRAKNPGFRAELRSRSGDANLKGAIVNLPPSQFIDNSHISNPCTRVQFNADSCPRASILGRARAFTPLLEDPLEGNVYFRSNGGERKLPDLVVALRGTFDYNLVIAVLEAKGHVKTKVLNAPDAPVSRFVLRMFKGKRSLLENSEHLCRKRQRARLNLIGQNGARHKTRPVIKTSCAKKKKKKSRSRAHRRARR